METLEAINKRASLKAHLSPRDIKWDIIAKVLGTARLAPSARNNQPWRYIVVRGKDAVETLVSKAFSEANQVVKEAPVIIVACANPSDDIVRDGKEYYLLDVGMAVADIRFSTGGRYYFPGLRARNPDSNGSGSNSRDFPDSS